MCVVFISIFIVSSSTLCCTDGVRSFMNIYLGSSVSGADLRNPKKAARRRARHAFRPGTNANHSSQIEQYIGFCLYYGLRYVDPDPSTLCLYAEFLARSFSSPRAIRNYISGVRTRDERGYVFDAHSHPHPQ